MADSFNAGERAGTERELPSVGWRRIRLRLAMISPSHRIASRPEVRPRRWRTVACAAAALAWGASLSGGCSDTLRRARPRAQANPASLAGVPSILRGVIGTEATLRGLEPMLVSGYGIVVDLDGTGSTEMPAPVRAMMEREMALKGVGQETMGMGSVTPNEMLNDPNTAVVLVQAVIPPGVPQGWRFDVFVSAVPGSSVVSLEGGRLWTTELQPGLASPGGAQRAPIAEARGPIFINPFSGSSADDASAAINRSTGRILNGGVANQPAPLALILNTPSHARSRAITAAINAKFPRGQGDREPTAIGRNEELIEINIPQRFRDDPVEFAQLLLNTRIDISIAEEWASRYVRALQQQPELAEPLAWRLRAIGEPALPFVRELYSFAEAAPRFAALEIGAALGDALAAPALLDIARNGPDALRVRAIELLGELDSAPAVNLALRELLDTEELDIRVAAYEALDARGDIAINRRWVEGKFRLDTAPAADPMIYVTQQGEPRIVIFGGADAELARPLFVSAWDDRLLLTADSPAGDVRVFYRDEGNGGSRSTAVSPRLDELTVFLAHESTPEAPAPGLNFTYSEVVGALHAIWRDGGYEGAFVAEQDRLAAEILRAAQGAAPPDRPEGGPTEGAAGGDAAGDAADASADPPAAEPPPARPDGA